ncbi:MULTISPECIES: helix-turn-helix transcriptional regulator [Rhodococcus]|uniref:helix-turn-helix transcriptional regulator n=1 Tax=Rhodococcus TaxID=1827 RepID=UPI0008061BD4|nr:MULTISPECIES: helix-turn-helix transcriptional regulator [Rhodococcus]ANQ73282.1 hypothetical protein AOT96_22340 [Rhodococcus sp. 008]MCZ4546192.1 helix-turn-helix transcriptional regulator [Rhodococcus qingshengii]OKA13056.1 hypothetical protein BS618_20825 [Rhodococcus erythropolis]UGQ53339.1 helix-turn-helix transcriptional regulator [Rhodococcus qingshengii]
MSTINSIGAVQLGHRLTQLREQTGRKQGELAKQVTWSPAMLSRIEAGDRQISDEELSLLLAAIGTREATELAEALARDWSILPRPALDHSDQDLLWDAEQLADSLLQLAVTPSVRPAFERRLQEYIEEIREAAKLLLRREHGIAFIGSIGAGKSTAICRATGLEVEGQQGRPSPVLETGGGGITLCEVHLRVGPGYGIVVEPRTHDDIRVDVEDFVDQLLRAGQPDTKDEHATDGFRAVPREIERAIRNMAGLNPTRTKGADGKTVRSDPAKDLATAIPSKRELVVELLTRMGLHRRDRRDEWFDPSIASSPLDWLKSTFERINNGRHPEFSLPTRIELVLPELMANIPGLTINIVDTRGIDQPTGRADLESHLEDPHTVAVLCSSFNAAPEQSVQHLLKRARDIGNPQIDSNCAILVLARPEEALAVKDETGLRAESIEEGYELKSEQVSVALGPYQLDSMPVEFFNALDDDPNRLRDFLANRVAHTRQEFRRQLRDILANAENLIANAEQEQVLEVQRDASRLISSWAKNNREPATVRSQIHDTLFTEISSAHASSVHAAARRGGEWRSLSYSHQLGFGARRLAVLTLRDSVKSFTSLCETLSDSMPEANELLSQAARLMSQTYDDLLKKMQLSGKTLYRKQLQEDTAMWTDCLQAWGQGSGYRNRVVERNRDWFAEEDRVDLEGELRMTLAREWTTLLSRLGAIFDTD